MENPTQVSIVHEALYDMYGRELDRSTQTIKPNGEKHFGQIPIIKLENGWYDFTQLPQEKNYVKIDALNCGTDRKAMNRAKKICPNLPSWQKFFFITQQKHEAYEKKLKDDLAKEQK